MKIVTQQQEAENLRTLFAEINKAEFARVHKVPGGPSMLSQHISGHRPISLDAAICYAKGLNCSLYDISPRLYAEIEKAKSIDVKSQHVIESPVAEYSSNINIPLLNVVASMGNGNEVEHEVVIDVLRVSKTWVERTLSPITDIKNLSFIHAIGDSMSPTFNDGDILLVDTGNKSISADKIYVLEAHSRLFVKRVRQRIDGEYEISSDNSAIKTVDILNGKHEVNIKGRVVWIWNGKKV